MQKRKVNINYGNTDNEKEPDYTFVIPSEKYKDINITISDKEKNKKEVKKVKKN